MASRFDATFRSLFSTFACTRLRNRSFDELGLPSEIDCCACDTNPFKWSLKDSNELKTFVRYEETLGIRIYFMLRVYAQLGHSNLGMRKCIAEATAVWKGRSFGSSYLVDVSPVSQTAFLPKLADESTSKVI